MNIETNPILFKCARISNNKVIYECELSEYEFRSKNYALAINRSTDRFVKREHTIVDSTSHTKTKVILPGKV